MRKINLLIYFGQKITNFNQTLFPKCFFSSNKTDEKSILSIPPISDSKDLQKAEEFDTQLTQELSDKYKIVLTEDLSKLMDDYTASPTMLKFKEDSSNEFFPFQSSTGFNINTTSELQLKDNPLALQILTEGKIDLKNEAIKLENSSIQDLSFYSLNELKSLNNNMAQINVGEIDILPKNSILLEDVDVYNIPEDKDIVLNPNKKKMMVVGHKIQKEIKGNKSDFNEKNKGEFYVSKNLFEELNFEEFKKKYLFDFESRKIQFHKALFFRQFFKYWPFLVLFAYFSETVIEIYQTKSDNNLLEMQEMEIFNKVREKYMKDIILTNDLYNRANYK